MGYGTSNRATAGWSFQFGYIISIIQAIRLARGAQWSAVRIPIHLYVMLLRCYGLHYISLYPHTIVLSYYC